MNAVLVEELAAGEFLQLAHGVSHADGDIIEWGFDGGGGLAPAEEAVAAVDALDQYRLGCGGAAVGGDDAGDIRHGVGMIAWAVSGGQSAEASGVEVRRKRAAAASRLRRAWRRGREPVRFAQGRL